MKAYCIFFLFAAGPVASAQIRADQYDRDYGWKWAIGTQDAGGGKTWEGGDLRAPGVEAGNKRQPGPARYEDVRCTLNARLEPVLQEWLRGALDGEAPARDIHFVELKRDGSAAKAALFQASKITELVVPTFDGDELDTEAVVTLKFAPGSVQALAQAPAITAAASGKENRRKVFTNYFKLSIDGLDGQDVVKVASITVRLRAGSAPQVSNFVLTMAEHPGTIGAWKAWFDSFVVQGNNADTQEKSGTLEIGDRGLPPHLTLAFKGLGILRMSRRLVAEGNAGNVHYHEVELYCEGMSVRTAGAAAAPAPAASTAAATPVERPSEKPVAAPGTAEDKGARDPEGVPRFPESQRTTFTASRSKVGNDERADYVTRAAPDKVEAWAVEAMKSLGWKDVSRDETGSVKERNYKIDARWEREKKTARLILSLAKDGSTTIYWQVVTIPK